MRLLDLIIWWHPLPFLLMKFLSLLPSYLSLCVSSPAPSLNLSLIQESLATPSGYMFCISETL